MSEHKRGRLGDKEKAYIEEHCGDMSDERIAAILNRHTNTVAEYRKQVLAKGENVDIKAITDKRLEKILKTKPYWKNLKEQFSENELDLFIFHWCEIIQQFNEDVTATEELQTLELIRLGILVHRAVKEKNVYIKQKERLEDAIDKQYKLDADERDKDLLINMERNLGLIVTSQQIISKEYTDLQDKQQKLFKDLKATRLDRIKINIDSKSTWNSLMLALQEEDNRTREGKEMAIMKGALDMETKRLSEYHQYMDQGVDRPLLTPETVMEEQEDE